MQALLEAAIGEVIRSQSVDTPVIRRFNGVYTRASISRSVVSMTALSVWRLASDAVFIGEGLSPSPTMHSTTFSVCILSPSLHQRDFVRRERLPDGLPNDMNTITAEQGVAADNRDILDEGLGNEQAVKRVAVMVG